MAFAATPYEYFPALPTMWSGLPSFATANLLLDAIDETAVQLFDAPKTGNIDAVYFSTRTVTTGATLDIRLETLNRTATPAINSGTLWGTNTNGSQVVADANDNVGFTVVLTAVAAVTRGDPIALVIKNPAVSPGNLIIAAMSDDNGSGYPYALLNGVAAFSMGAVLGVRYDDGLFYPVRRAYPISAITTTTYSSASTPDTFGHRFQVPVARRVCGFWTWTDFDGDLTVKLVSSDYHQVNNAATLKVERTINNEDRISTAVHVCEWLFPTDVELSANTFYRLIFEPGATGISVYDMTFDSAALMAGIDAGTDLHLTTAKDPTADGSWTNYNSGTFRRMFGGLIFNGIDSGGGGVLIPGGMVGGFRG